MADDVRKKPPAPKGPFAAARDAAKGLGERLAENAAELKEGLERTTRDLRSGQTWTETKERAQRVVENTGEAARHIISALANAPADLDHRPDLLDRFISALGSVRGQLDSEANAIALGFLTGSGAGVMEVRGTEVLYLRGDGPVRAQLRVSSMHGRYAHLKLSATTGAYAACLYGPRETLARAGRRTGADVGALVASIGFFRVTVPRISETAGGFMVSLGAELGLGIPILSQFSGFELEESMLGGFGLDPDETRRVEDAIAGAPDRSWRRRIAKTL